MQEFLGASCLRLLFAESTEEAVTLCRDYQGPIHILIADDQISSSCGWDLAERASAIRPGLVVLFVSKETVAGRAREMPAGAEPSSHRPFAPHILLEVTQALAMKTQQSTRVN